MKLLITLFLMPFIMVCLWLEWLLGVADYLTPLRISQGKAP